MKREVKGLLQTLNLIQQTVGTFVTSGQTAFPGHPPGVWRLADRLAVEGLSEAQITHSAHWPLGQIPKRLFSPLGTRGCSVLCGDKKGI